MATGLAREHWYPPRDMAQPRSARAAWAKRWAVASGRNAKQTEAALAVTLAQAQRAGEFADPALRQALARAAQGLRFMNAEAASEPTPAWRRQRAELDRKSVV